MARKIKPKKYWQSLENTIFESKKVMKKHNYDKLPSSRKLRELCYGSLVTAITIHHGGINNFREKHLGEELSRKPRGYYQSLENTISETKKVMEEHNFDAFPSGNKLIEIGYVGLSNGINTYHGGFNNFREKHFGEEPLKKPNGYYTLENTISESKKVMEEHGFDTLPSSNKLKELGYHGLNAAISNYHGGFNNFREKHLGEEPLKKPNGYYTSENTIDKTKKFMKEHNYDTLPSSDKLNELGYGGLTNAIKRHHGGFPNFREIMNQELGIKSKEEHLTELVEDYLKD